MISVVEFLTISTPFGWNLPRLAGESPKLAMEAYARNIREVRISHRNNQSYVGHVTSSYKGLYHPIGYYTILL